MRILVTAKEDNCCTQMAKEWLRKFDNGIDVYSAGIEHAGVLDQLAVRVMAEAGIDMSRNTCEWIGKYFSQDWDYVISLAGDQLKELLCFGGRVKQILYWDFPDLSQQTGPEPILLEEYRIVRHELRNRCFDFYLLDLLGRQILGADSCGAECDL